MNKGLFGFPSRSRTPLTNRQYTENQLPVQPTGYAFFDAIVADYYRTK